MENENLEGEIGRRSARVYLPISLGAAALFFLAAGWAGETALAPRLGGALWVGLLTLIVSMPLVVAEVKSRLRRGASPEVAAGKLTTDHPNRLGTQEKG